MTGHRGAYVDDAALIIDRFTDEREDDFDPVQRPTSRWTTHALKYYLDVSNDVARRIGYDFTHQQELAS